MNSLFFLPAFSYMRDYKLVHQNIFFTFTISLTTHSSWHCKILSSFNWKQLSHFLTSISHSFQWNILVYFFHITIALPWKYSSFTLKSFITFHDFHAFLLFFTLQKQFVSYSDSLHPYIFLPIVLYSFICHLPIWKYLLLLKTLASKHLKLRLVSNQILNIHFLIHPWLSEWLSYFCCIILPGLEPSV